MRRLLPVVLVFFVLIALHREASGQSSCAQTLRTARTTYEQGRIHELPELLSGCLISGFTKQEKVEAYKLLTLSYIYLEEPAKADEALLSLLRTDPYFEINPEADAAEFISLYRTFRTWPIYRVGAKAGVNATQPNILSRIEVPEGATSKFSRAVSFQVGGAFEVPLSQSLALNPELHFQLKSFHYQSEVPVTATAVNITEATESMMWLSLPVSVQYTLSDHPMNPYVSLGASADYLIQSDITVKRTRVNANALQERTLDVTDGRNNLNLSGIASIGVKRRLGGGYFNAEVRISYGFSSISKPEYAYTLDEFLLFDYAYADNEFRINSLSLTVGYLYNVFSPKKIKNK